MNSTERTRRPWLAAAMSLACPGLGQVYAGAIARGLGLLLASWLIVPAAALIVSFGPPSTSRLVGLLGAVVVALGIVGFAVIDAAILAARGTRRVDDPWNRPLVYGLLFLLGGVGSAASTAAVRTHLFCGYRIVHDSMAPTLFGGDRVLTRRLGAGRGTPPVGSVVAFRNPADREQVFVKRVASAPDLPPGQCWVLGDDLDRSLDSRSFGPVPVGDVLGEVQYIFWPPQRFGTTE